jgi:hypothetical protein
MAICNDKLDSVKLYVQLLHENAWSLSTVTAVVLFCREPPNCTTDVFSTSSVGFADDLFIITAYTFKGVYKKKNKEKSKIARWIIYGSK